MTLTLPNENLQVIVRKALNEDLNTRDRDLETIKTWLKQQPHLPDTWDELGLLNFLRGSRFSLEQAKKRIDMFFTMRAAAPELFTDRDVKRPEFEKIFKLGNASFLPDLTPDGNIVAIANADIENDFLDLSVMYKIITMVGDIRLVSDTYGYTSDIYILDARVSILKSFLRISPVLTKKLLICLQEAYPVTIKEVHIINPHPFVAIILNAIKPFLTEKLGRRIHIHNKMDTLYNFVPKEMLPEEYGGNSGKLSEMKEKWFEKFEEFGPWFKEQEAVKADESRRVGERISYDNMFGVDGSFRNLTID